MAGGDAEVVATEVRVADEAIASARAAYADDPGPPHEQEERLSAIADAVERARTREVAAIDLLR